MVYHEPTLALEPTLIRSHYSALSAHRECEARWYYRYVLKLRKPDFGPKPELHFGSWWGALVAAEGLERGRRLESLRSDPTRIQGPDDSNAFNSRDVTVQMILDEADRWWKTRDAETLEEWNIRLGQPLPLRLRELFDRWLDKYAEERKTEHPMGYEVFWKRQQALPQTDREWLGPDGGKLEAVDLIGYIDEVYWDAGRDMVVIRDDKSHKALKSRSALTDMMDSQLQLYAWGATPLISTWGHGAPKAVGYDRVKSTMPKSPELTKTAGTLSKGVTDYDVSTYIRWATTDTRPTVEIMEWLKLASPTPTGEFDEQTGEEIIVDPEINATEEQVDFVRDLPAGQFWGEFGAFLASGPRKGNPKFGVYTMEEKVIEHLSTPQADSVWFQRTRKPLNRNVVIAHLRAALDTATDAWRTKLRVDITGDAPRSLGKACEWCDYASLCQARIFGGANGEYDLREHALEAPEGATFLINGKLASEAELMLTGAEE
jgi:hypothetical protein